MTADPYLTWTIATDRRYLVAAHANAPVRIAGVLRPNSSLKKIRDCVADAGSTLASAEIPRTGYFTAELGNLTQAAWDALAPHADVVLAEPGMWPMRSGIPAGWDRQRRDLPKAVALCRQDVVIGVVDGLCGFANKRFMNSGECSIDYFWDQGGTPGVDRRWHVGHGGYGRSLDAKALQKISKAVASREVKVGRVGAEKELYRELGQREPTGSDWTHGTHVLDTILSDFGPPGDDPTLYQRPGVVYVQLPEPALRDTSGRWTAAYVLEGIACVLARARDDAKVVINLSLGAFAGPHDGSSMLERAMDQLVQAYDGRLTFVVAAGNSGLVLDDGTGVPKCCHQRFTLNRGTGPLSRGAARAKTLLWDIDVQDDTESFMELWLPDLRLEEACGVSVQLRSEALPQFQSKEVAPGEDGDIRGVDDRIVAMVINRSGSERAPNGNGGMVLIALGHTRDPHGEPCAPSGRWEIEIKNLCPRPVTVDAWIERRDIPGELPDERPQYGFANLRKGVVDRGGLGSLANGGQTIVVGALAQMEQSEDFLYSESAYSPNGVAGAAEDCNCRGALRRQPDIHAAGERLAAGFFSGTAKTLAGTSCSAAEVTAVVAYVVQGQSAGQTVLDAVAEYAMKRQPEPSSMPSHGPSTGSEAAEPERPPFILPPPKERRTDIPFASKLQMGGVQESANASVVRADKSGPTGKRKTKLLSRCEPVVPEERAAP